MLPDFIIYLEAILIKSVDMKTIHTIGQSRMIGKKIYTTTANTKWNQLRNGTKYLQCTYPTKG